MSDHEEKKEESLLEKLADKFHSGSSSSDSDNDKSEPSEIKGKIFRLFGREKPVHKVFGGGKRTSFVSFLGYFSSASVLEDCGVY